MNIQKKKPTPEINDKGLRILTEKYACEVCEMNGGTIYPYLNKTLYLNLQAFHKIENIQNFTNLKTLYLESNQIEKIENLDTLVNLQCLFLQENLISKIENLDKLVDLTILNLSKNRIEKIENLECLQKLTKFYIANNSIKHISDLKGITYCQKLLLFDISFNLINDKSFPEFFDILTQLKNLNVLYFQGNESIRYFNNYRREMILKLEKLTYLDQRPVNEEDRIGALANLKGGIEAERKARFEYRQKKEGINDDKLKQKEKNKLMLEERKKKAINNCKIEYENKKIMLENKLENFKNILNNLNKNNNSENSEDIEYSKNKVNLEIENVKYQLEEYLTYNNEEIENITMVLNKRNKTNDNENFIYESWMDDIIKKNVYETNFDFGKALDLIKVELFKKEVRNYDLFNEIDLRTKWSEMEFGEFREGKFDDFYYEKNNAKFLKNCKDKDFPYKDYIEIMGADFSYEEEKKDEDKNKPEIGVYIKINEGKIDEKIFRNTSSIKGYGDNNSDRELEDDRDDVICTSTVKKKNNNEDLNSVD